LKMPWFGKRRESDSPKRGDHSGKWPYVYLLVCPVLLVGCGT
jgi:hypothetical protein